MRVAGFEVESELGRGAMGVVYRARETATGRHVALKVLAAHLARDPVKQARFQSEGQAMAALRHPGIVGIHQAGVDGGVAWLACELVDGARSLGAAAKGATLRRKVEWVRDAARALGHSHARGIVHRDVKPENLLVDTSGRVRVADFGVALAEERERLTLTGQMVGTPLFMAPEQLLGRREQLGPAIDVWALGVILYELLTGRHPFDAGSLVSLAALVSTTRPQPPHELAPDVPRALEAVVLAALSVDPGLRPGDGEALAGELDAWLAGETPGAARTVAHADRRRLGRLVAALAAGLALTLVVAILGRPPWRRHAAATEVEAAVEWDGAACAQQRRQCNGGSHLLAEYAFGSTGRRGPTQDELDEWRRRLTAATPTLEAESDHREAARETLSRIVAHERLLTRTRAGSEGLGGSAEQVVEALLLVADPAAAPAAVTSAYAAALRAPDPGAGPALARACACTAQLTAGRPVAPAVIAAAIVACPPAERDMVVRLARKQVAKALAQRVTHFYTNADFGELEANQPLVELAEALGVEADTTDRPKVVQDLLTFELRATTGAKAEISSRTGQVVASDDGRSNEVRAFWSAFARQLAATDEGGARSAVARLVGVLESSAPGAAVKLLRGLRLIAIEESREPEDVFVAMRFDGESARFNQASDDPGEVGPFRMPPPSTASGPEAIAEGAAFAQRWGGRRQPDKSATTVEALRKLAAARPWSRATRAALFLEVAPTKSWDRQTVTAGLEVFDAEVDDLHPEAVGELVSQISKAIGELVSADAPEPELALLDAAADDLARRLAAAAPGRWRFGTSNGVPSDVVPWVDLVGAMGVLTLARRGTEVGANLRTIVGARLRSLGQAVEERSGRNEIMPRALAWPGAWLVTGTGKLFGYRLVDDVAKDRLELAASFLRATYEVDRTSAFTTMLLAHVLVRVGDLTGAERVVEQLAAGWKSEASIIRVEIALARGDTSAALTLIDGALRVEPDVANRRRLEALRERARGR